MKVQAVKKRRKAVSTVQQNIVHNDEVSLISDEKSTKKIQAPYDAI